jgi:hypothetical protein
METRDFLASIGLPRGDLHELPSSPGRFPDALGRERVRRARLGLDLLARSGADVAMSGRNAPGLAVPQPARVT